jgi:hypothetical protein
MPVKPSFTLLFVFADKYCHEAQIVYSLLLFDKFAARFPDAYGRHWGDNFPPPSVDNPYL